MKSREVVISIKLITDIPMKWLKDKRRWQTLFDVNYNLIDKPVAHDFYVEKVDAVKLKSR